MRVCIESCRIKDAGKTVHLSTSELNDFCDNFMTMKDGLTWKDPLAYLFARCPVRLSDRDKVQPVPSGRQDRAPSMVISCPNRHTHENTFGSFSSETDTPSHQTSFSIRNTLTGQTKHLWSNTLLGTNKLLGLRQA